MAIDTIEQLKKLDFNKQLVFAYLTCERLYPNYVYFSQNYNFGEPSILRDAIDYLYSNLLENNFDKNTVDNLIKKVDKNTPDTEDFDTAFVSSALDACTAVGDNLDFLIDKDFSRIKSIFSYAIDTVDMYIQEIESLDFNKDKYFQQKIDNHPLMQKELAIQQGIVTFLCNTKSIDYGDIQTLLHLQENNKKSNLNL